MPLKVLSCMSPVVYHMHLWSLQVLSFSLQMTALMQFEPPSSVILCLLACKLSQPLRPSPKEKRNTIILQPLTQRHRNTSKHYVSFVNAADAHNVASYSDCYGCFPRSFVVDVNASGIPFLKSVASDCDQFTGKSSQIMQARRIKHGRNLSHARTFRQHILTHLLHHLRTQALRADQRRGAAQGAETDDNTHVAYIRTSIDSSMERCSTILDTPMDAQHRCAA